MLLAPWLYFGVAHGVFPLLYVSLALCVFLLWQKSGRTVALTGVDLWVAVYLLYGACSLLLVRQSPVDVVWLCKWIMLIGGYVAARNVRDKEAVVWAIALAGMLQAVAGILQMGGLMMSRHEDFMVTGSFPNPGPYGGFLAVAFVSMFWLVRRGVRYRMPLYVAMAVTGVMLVVSDSRAAWVAALGGVAALLPIWKNRWAWIAGGILGGVFVFGLYAYRPGSVEARLLIWQVCVRLISERPFLGYGVGTLPQYYMNAQAEYFGEHPDSPFAIVANNNYQAFNEFIHLGVEQGIVGVILFVGLIFACAKASSFPLLLAWLLFSLFSYPADIPACMFVLVGLFALCAKREKLFVLSIRRVYVVIPCLLLLFAGNVNGRYCYAMKHVESSEKAMFPLNMDYMLRFVRAKQEIGVFERMTREVCVSTDILCDMGDIYKANGYVEKADSCYRLACAMVPCRIVPLYKLFVLYRDIDPERGRVYAQKIAEFQSSVVGTVVLRARAEARRFLDSD